jgi:hypothetical protein
MKTLPFEDQLFAALADYRREHAGAIPELMWKQIARETFAAVCTQMGFHKKPRFKTAKGAVTDEEWLAQVEADPAMAGVDVRRELARMEFWCKGKGLKSSRARFRNWLLKAQNDGTISRLAGQRVAVSHDIYREPAGWQEVCQRLYPVGDMHLMKWADIGPDYRKEIVRAML